MDAGTNFNRFQPQQPDEHDARPGSAVSVATSTSSFRIPGIRPGPSNQNHNSQSFGQQTSHRSLVRLFAPQADGIDPSWHDRDRDQQALVPWLHKGPSPSELLDSAQGPDDGLYAPRQHMLRNDDRPDIYAAPGIRPGTTRSDEMRPFTASSYHRSKLITADGFVGNYVCALLESRGAGREVGIASIERETGKNQGDRGLQCFLDL